MKLFSRTSVSIAVVAAALLSGGAILSANAGGYGQRGGMHGGDMMFMQRGMGRMLDSVDATDEQRAQIKQIAEAARADLRAQRAAGKTMREQARDLFAQPTVDADAAEALRQQMMAQADRSSQRTMQAMLEVSRVLTPEQRQQIAVHMKERADKRAAHRAQRSGEGR